MQAETETTVRLSVTEYNKMLRLMSAYETLMTEVESHMQHYGTMTASYGVANAMRLVRERRAEIHDDIVFVDRERILG